MTPSLPDILMGQGLSLVAPQPPEASGDYTAGRVWMIFLLANLAAQEAERGLAARVWENGALRALFGRSAGAYDQALDGRLSAAAATSDADYAWSALDRANADLRRLLIALHEAVEERSDQTLNSEIIGLYQAMAQARRLELVAS